MAQAEPVSLREDAAGFVRWYIDHGFDGSEDVESVWGRTHTPDARHIVDQQSLDRRGSLRRLRRWRLREIPYDLQIRDTVVEGDRAAVRYTITTGLLWELGMETEHIEFHRLGDDDRIAGTVAASRTRYVWGAFRRGAGPGPEGDYGTSSASTGTAEDVAAYLREYNQLVADTEAPADGVFERFHAPEAVLSVNGRVKHRPDMVAAIRRSRKKGIRYDLEIHDVLRRGDRFAARYSMTPLRKRDGRRLELFDFGRMASDGRVASLRTAAQGASGSWPS